MAKHSDDKKPKKRKILIYIILSLVLISAATTVYLLRNSLWDSWLRRGEIVNVNGVMLREKDAAAFIGTPDEDLWREQEDIEKVSDAIGEQIGKFKKAAAKNDLKAVIKLFDESRREYYENIFQKDKENLTLIGEAFENMEMTYLSPKVGSREVTEKRIAEYIVIYEGQSFSVVFIYNDGKWLIYSI